MIAEKLRTAREALGMSQKELAELCGIEQPHISAYENGRMPTIPTLQKLCKALGLKPCELI